LGATDSPATAHRLFCYYTQAEKTKPSELRVVSECSQDGY
jgi:hypothetical protein